MLLVPSLPNISRSRPETPEDTKGSPSFPMNINKTSIMASIGLKFDSDARENLIDVNNQYSKLDVDAHWNPRKAKGLT